MTTDYLESVKEFNRMCGVPVGESPKNLDVSAFARRMRLILEEASEYATAVSIGSLPDIADALGDLLYVVFGAAIEHGMPMDEVFRQIHVSNMSKKGGYRDAGGKFIKPDTYKPVDLSWIE